METVKEMCGDNRFEVIKKAKEDLIESTNIETSPEEMAVIDNILYRAWQMGWLSKYEQDAPDTNVGDKWVSVDERLPEAETEVLVMAVRTFWYGGKEEKRTIITNGLYEDGTKNTEDSEWSWYDHDFEYDEDADAYIIPEGWWEYKHYNQDEEFNHQIEDRVTHWMPLPEPPRGVR